MPDAIEKWTTSNRIRIIISPSGLVLLCEVDRENQEHVTPLYGEEPEQIAQFIIKNAREIRNRRIAAHQEQRGKE